MKMRLVNAKAPRHEDTTGRSRWSVGSTAFARSNVNSEFVPGSGFNPKIRLVTGRAFSWFELLSISVTLRRPFPLSTPSLAAFFPIRR